MMFKCLRMDFFYTIRGIIHYKQQQTHLDLNKIKRTDIRHSLLPSPTARGQFWLIIKERERERETLQSPVCGREDGEMRGRDTCGWEKRLRDN